MRRYKALLILFAVLMSTMRIMAQDVIVSVTPVQSVLPPQLQLYITDPDKFFNVSLINTSGEQQDVYLGMQLEHVNPDDGLNINTPVTYQPAKPFTIPANGSYSLTTVDMKNLFNHIPSNAMQIPDGLIDGYMNGSFGLLPEGLYEVQFQAYKWKNPKYANPVACSNPMGGKNTFTVCYNASAPTFLTPVIGMGDDFAVAEMSLQNPQFSWTQPVLACNPKAYTYTYSVRIVEVIKNQKPDVAMDNNPVVYQRDGLMAPLLILDNVTLKSKFSTDKTYAAQVTATQSGGSALDYVALTNGGKSPLRLFKLVEGKVGGGDDDSPPSISVTMGNLTESGEEVLYKFRNPDITSPGFLENQVRRCYQGSDLNVSWDPAWYIGGQGENPYDLKMEYTVQLYNGGQEADTAKAFAQKPIYTKTLKEYKHTISWDDIKEKVNLTDYLVLRVKANCTDDVPVTFVNDSINVIDFTLVEHFKPQFFECSNTVIIENYKITDKKAKDFEGKEVGLGEYQLTIDKIESGDAKKGFKGRGRVKWDLPIGTAMVHVKFDTLRINTDDVVIGGLATSYAQDKMTNYQAVENIFSDLGLEDMLAKTGVPYADKLTSGAKKTVSEKIDGLANYYSLVKSSGSILDILTGGTADIYMPICLPKDKLSTLNSSPVDIQITTMKFAPTWATMDLIGIFTMPDSKCLASDLLVFGAPRLCISPNHLIPEAGTLALLDKFTVKDPNTEFDCTFNAPTDLLKPTDGCYVAWKDYKFEVMGVDIDMTIPKLKKYDVKADKLTDEAPNLKMKGFIASWDNFKIDEVTMDPFESEDLPGFTFTASKIGYDHSLFSNCDAMSGFKFPDSYDKKEGVGEAAYNEHGLDGWEGLYIGELSIAMPKGITGTDGRLKIAGKNMLFDHSGVTLDAELEELIGAHVGDFAFEINRVGLSFIQNDFNKCYIDGSLTVPLIKNEKEEAAKIGLNCQIRKQIDEKGNQGDEFVYVFNTKSLNGDYLMDVFVAKLVLDEKLTYMLVEAEPQKKNENESELKTRAELLLGGRIEIGGQDWLQKELGFKFSMPDIHFVGMRMANCKPWKSKYVDLQADIEKERQQQKKDAKLNLYLAGKEIHNGKKEDGSDATFFFHTGSWSLASYKKQLGPFEFSIEDYKMDKKLNGSNLDLTLDVTGKVALVKGLDISAEVGVYVTGTIKNVGTDLSKITGEFGGVDPYKMAVDVSFCGMGIKGSVEYDSTGKDPTVGKGFAASLDITLPGNLFSVHGDGGYFDYDNNGEQYSWGWVHVSISGTIVVGPCSITKLGGGFYMNCSRNPAGDDKRPNNVAGLVGIFLELGMASPDGQTIRGDLTLNVVYNRKRKCLSNFTMTGNVKAVGGIINANMTLVYENTETDRYLQLNITVDATLSAESMAGALDSFGANLGTIQDQMKKLAGNKYVAQLAGCKQGLSSKIGAHASDKDADKDPDDIKTSEENPSDVAKKAKTSKQGGLPKAGATISLDVKITWRAGGTNYTKPKWHVYLGEPAEDKRCTLTLIDYDSPGGIVSCHIGANAYICVGNELPNNGELPPLPAKIAKFLDGSKHGDFQSDNAAQAQSARQTALQGFNGEISGGVMLGAMGYGDIGIDLGIIEGRLEAILGFDISVVHYKNGYCVNLGKIPGYKGWYGKGQLYAYLYFMLALHFNLGFIDYDFTLANAEIGGVLKMGGPSPNYFQGKCRAKINLLGGLFKLDKSFEFDCGEYCQLFKGNPLDDFILFDDCTLGDTIRGKGWTVDEDKTVSITADMQPKVKKNVRTPQYANTKAPIGEHFRLLDENELERIAGQFGEGSEDWEKSKMQAKRTFIFRDFGEVWLFEYSSPSKYKEHSKVAENASFTAKKNNALEYCGADHRYIIPLEKGGSKSRRYIDLGTLRSKLKAGKFYRLVAAGYAKEIQKGVEVDPYTYYNNNRNVGNIAWVKSTEYFFQTEKDNIVNDKAPLQDYVALAYPSHYNQLRSPEASTDSRTGLVTHMKAYLGDVQAPTIALTEDLRSKAFMQGKLYWRLLNPMGKQLDIVENAWVETTTDGVSAINMEPKRKLNAKAGEKYILQLDYYTRENVPDEFDPNSKTWQTVDTTLVKLYVETLDSKYNWKVGVPMAGKLNCDYDQPFIAQRLTSTTIDRPWGSGMKRNLEILDGNYYTKCPITFISYMSNFALPAGWEITERNWFGIEVTTSESMLFIDPGHGGKYEGAYNENKYQVYNQLSNVKNSFVYVIPSDASVQYPLSGYWHKGGYGDWDYVQDVDERIPYYNPHDVLNFRVTPVFTDIEKVYNRVNYISNKINSTAVDIENTQRKVSDTYTFADGSKYSLVSYSGYGTQANVSAVLQGKKQKLKEWYANHRGTYLNEDGDYVFGTDDNHSFYVPAYQFPVIWSICGMENINGAYKGMKANNDRAEKEGPLWSKLTGMTWYYGYQASYTTRTKVGKSWHSTTHKYWTYSEQKAETKQKFNLSDAKALFKSANILAYRVNSYDTNSGHYYVSGSLLNGGGWMKMTVQNPLTNSKKTSVSTYGTGNTGSSSKGTVSGTTTSASAVEKTVDKTTSTSTLTSYQMENYLKRVVQIHDSCAWVFKVRSAYWPRYRKWVEKMVKPAKNAEEEAILTVAQYSYGTSASQSYINTHKKKTQDNIKEARIWRDSVTLTRTYLNPASYFTQGGKKTYRETKGYAANINYIMDRFITPQSDPNDAQYKRYRSMQDEVNSWNTQLTEWYDSVYNSMYKTGGYFYEYNKKVNWAEDHLKAMTQANYNKVDAPYQQIIKYKNSATYGSSCIQKKAQTAYDKAISTLRDAAANNTSLSWVNSLTRATTFVSNHNEVLRSHQKADASLEEMDEYCKTLDGYMDYIGGSDGKSGQLAFFKSVFNERCRQYYYGSQYLEDIRKVRQTISTNSATIQSKLAKLPTYEESEKLIEEGKRLVDKYSGRDRAKFDHEMQRLDSLLGVVQQKSSKYETEANRRSGYDKMQDCYREAKRASNAFYDGDLSQIPVCIEQCNKFDEEQKSYFTYYDDLIQLVAKIPTMPDFIWNAMQKAGYSSGHELVMAAKKKWEDENGLANLESYKPQVKKWYDSSKSLANSIKAYRNDALEKQQDNSSLLGNVGPYVVKVMNAMKKATLTSSGQTFSKTAKYSNEVNSLVKTYDQRESDAKKAWDAYVALLPVMNVSASSYESRLQACISECTNTNEVIDKIQKYYNENCAALMAQAVDSIKKADDYLAMIPVDNPKVSNAQSSYKTAKGVHASVVDYYKTSLKLRDNTQKIYNETLPQRYKEEIEPLKKQAEEALAYLEKNGKPDRPKSVMVTYYYKQLQSFQALVYNTRSNVNQNDTKAKSAMNRVNSYYNNMKTGYSRCKSRTYTSSTKSSYLNDVNTCVKQCDIMLMNVRELKGYYDDTKSSYDAVSKKLADAKAAYDYINANASSGSVEYKNGQKLYSVLTSDLKTIYQTMTAMYEKQVKPAEQKNAEALKIKTDVQVAYYYKQLRYIQTEMDNIQKRVAQYESSTSSAMSLLSSRYTTMNSYWNKYYSTKKIRQNKSALNSYLSYCGTYAENVISYANTVMNNYNSAKTRSEDVNKMKNDANTAYDYIRRNASSASTEYRTNSSTYNGINTLANRISNSMTRLTNYKNDASSRNSAARTMKTRVTDAKKSVSKL